MSYLVIAYPSICKSDFEWIQDIRKKSDNRYFDVVNPHFTLVFGTDKLDINELVKHVTEKVKGFRKFNICLDSAILVEDDSKEFYHAFLIPSDGFNEINELHDRLYSGPLGSELRTNIPFIPHVGIGTNDNKPTIEKLVGDLNQEKRKVMGSVDELSIVEYNGRKIINRLSISLT